MANTRRVFVLDRIEEWKSNESWEFGCLVFFIYTLVDTKSRGHRNQAPEMFLPGEGHGVFSFGAVRVGGKILRDLVLGRQANQTVGSDRNPMGRSARMWGAGICKVLTQLVLCLVRKNPHESNHSKTNARPFTHPSFSHRPHPFPCPHHPLPLSRESTSRNSAQS